jgi:hypothetical protein
MDIGDTQMKIRNGNQAWLKTHKTLGIPEKVLIVHK